MRYRWTVLLLILVFPAPTRAQQTVRAWTTLRVSGLPIVYILDDEGAESAGTLLRLEQDAIVIQADGHERRFDRARVKRIQRRGDSLKNGALIGAAAGVVLGVVAGGIVECVGDDGRVRGCGALARLGIATYWTGVFASIGTAIDALWTGRTLLYEAPGSSSAASRGRPREGRTLAVQLSLRW